MNRNSAPLGVRFSAGLLVIVNYLAAFQLSAFALLEAADLLLKPHSQSLTFAVLVCFVLVLGAAFVRLSFKAAQSLYEGQRWGAYITFFWSAIFFLFACGFAYDIRHPERQTPDEYFGVVLIPPLVAMGLWWCIYLNLPQVRSYFREVSGSSIEPSADFSKG